MYLLQMKVELIVLLCVFIFIYTLVNNLHPSTMCFVNRLQCNSLNDQLSLEGMNEHCEYIESSQIKDIHTRNTDLSVIQLNIRGLLNKQYQINNLLCNGNVSLPIDVLLLCETWLKPSILDLVKLKSYKSYHTIRKDHTGGGTSILVHDKLVTK